MIGHQIGHIVPIPGQDGLNRLHKVAGLPSWHRQHLSIGILGALEWHTGSLVACMSVRAHSSDVSCDSRKEDGAMADVLLTVDPWTTFQIRYQAVTVSRVTRAVPGRMTSSHMPCTTLVQRQPLLLSNPLACQCQHSKINVDTSHA